MKKKYIFNLKSEEIKHLLNSDKRLSCLINNIGTLTYSLSTDYFNFYINTIISQMLSNKASTAIYNRLYNLCNNSITPANLNKLNIINLREIGISNAKANYILRLSEFIELNPKYFQQIKKYNDDYIYKELLKINGIGKWSIKMFLIFVLNRMDILPYEDVAFLQSFNWLYSTDKDNKEYVIKKCSSWRPYSSLAARYLYIALDSGLTNEKFKLNKILK